MAQVPSYIAAIADKYAPEVAGVTTPLEYKDARVESGSVLVKTHDMAGDLSGFVGWRFTVGKKARLGSVRTETWKELRPNEFVDWAKKQPVKLLQALLKQQGIATTGTVAHLLAYRLSYCAEEAFFKRRDAWPRTPEKMAQRELMIEAHDKFLHLKGVDNVAAIVRVRNYVDHGVHPSAYEQETDMPQPNEIAAIRKRLLEESRTGKAADDAKKPASTRKRGTGSEVEAIKAGKERAADPDPPNDTAPSAGAEESDVKKIKKTKGTATATKRSSKKAAKKSSSNGNGTAAKSGLKRSDVPVGSKVKYIRGRIENLIGKTAEVLRYRGPKGAVVKFSDGTVVAVMLNSLQTAK